MSHDLYVMPMSHAHVTCPCPMSITCMYMSHAEPPYAYLHVLRAIWRHQAKRLPGYAQLDVNHNYVWNAEVSKARYQGELLVKESRRTTQMYRNKNQLTTKRARTGRRRSRGQAAGLLSAAGYQQDRLRIQACCITTKTQSPSCSKLEHTTPVLNQSLSILEQKLGERVNKKLHRSRESDLLDVGLVVQKAKKQDTVLLVGFYWKLNSPTFSK